MFTDYSAQNLTETIEIPALNHSISAMTVNGWIIFQQRLSIDANFTFLWNRYRNGFGALGGDFWLGNEITHLLTSSGSYKLRMEMLSPMYGWVSAEYYYFLIDSEADYYRLHVAGYSGDCGDSMAYEGSGGCLDHNGMRFSTADNIHDLVMYNQPRCVLYLGGGWWFNFCYNANFNGNGSAGLSWWTLPYPYLNITRMMLKKNY